MKSYKPEKLDNLVLGIFMYIYYMYIVINILIIQSILEMYTWQVMVIQKIVVP